MYELWICLEERLVLSQCRWHNGMVFRECSQFTCVLVVGGFDLGLHGCGVWLFNSKFMYAIGHQNFFQRVIGSADMGENIM